MAYLASPGFRRHRVRFFDGAADASLERRKFTQKFQFAAVRLIKDRGVSYVQASEDLGVRTSQLRDWVKKLSDDPEHAFPGNGQMKPEQLEIARLKREVAKLKAERDILKTYGPPRLQGVILDGRAGLHQRIRSQGRPGQDGYPRVSGPHKSLGVIRSKL